MHNTNTKTVGDAPFLVVQLEEGSDNFTLQLEEGSDNFTLQLEEGSDSFTLQLEEGSDNFTLLSIQVPNIMWSHLQHSDFITSIQWFTTSI